jgi:hypothetical protein
MVPNFEDSSCCLFSTAIAYLKTQQNKQNQITTQLRIFPAKYFSTYFLLNMRMWSKRALQTLQHKQFIPQFAITSVNSQ